MDKHEMDKKQNNSSHCLLSAPSGRSKAATSYDPPRWTSSDMHVRWTLRKQAVRVHPSFELSRESHERSLKPNA